MPRKLSDLTVSLETARALEAAGFPQDTALIWTRFDAPMMRRPFVTMNRRGDDRGIDPCAAPMLAEILRELPDVIEHDTGDADLYRRVLWPSDDASTAVAYVPDDFDVSEPLRLGHHSWARVERPNAAEAAALLWLALVRAGHVTPEGEVRDA